MDKELKNLLESPEFLQYHQVHQNPPFNLFDVLRNAEFEIRHSNVLQWLLDPGGTHRTSSKFLRAFIQCLNDNADAAGIKPIPVPTSLEKDHVRVERELHLADIAVFFKGARRWMIVENKTVERSREHYRQVKGYEREFRKRYKGQYDDVRSVLLTTSSEGDDAEREVIHVSWSDVQELIQRVRDSVDAENAENTEVRTFLSHYLDVVKRLTTPSRLERSYFTKLVETHTPLLKRLAKETKEGQGEAPLPHTQVSADYRATVERLVNEFVREPKRLRTSIRSFLNAAQGISAESRQDIYGTDFWLSWRMDEVAKALGIEWRMKWELAFSHARVQAGLYFELNRKTRPVVKRIQEFMREEIATDLLTWEWKPGSSYVYIFQHRLVDEETLSAGSFEKVEKATRERVRAFLDSDYKIIQGYFKCLAADPKGFSVGEESA